jgi:hypothetical protein
MPEPWHPAHRLDAPVFDPFPLHFEQITFLDNDSFFEVPLYRSSNVTFNGCTTSSPLL